MDDYNYGRNSQFGPKSQKIIIFGKSLDTTFYVCYVMMDKIIIFEWLDLESAEIVDINPDKFLIKKIMDGYKVVGVPKTRSGNTFLKNEIYKKYVNLLINYYHRDSHNLDMDFRRFLNAALYDNEELLKKSMIRINSYIKLTKKVYI